MSSHKQLPLKAHFRSQADALRKKVIAHHDAYERVGHRRGSAEKALQEIRELEAQAINLHDVITNAPVGNAKQTRINDNERERLLTEVKSQLSSIQFFGVRLGAGKMPYKKTRSTVTHQQAFNADFALDIRRALTEELQRTANERKIELPASPPGDAFSLAAIKHLIAAHALPTPLVTCVDYSMGKGFVLRDLRRHFGDLVKLHGITLEDNDALHKELRDKHGIIVHKVDLLGSKAISTLKKLNGKVHFGLSLRGANCSPGATPIHLYTLLGIMGQHLKPGLYAHAYADVEQRHIEQNPDWLSHLETHFEQPPRPTPKLNLTHIQNHPNATAQRKHDCKKGAALKIERA